MTYKFTVDPILLVSIIGLIDCLVNVKHPKLIYLSHNVPTVCTDCPVKDAFCNVVWWGVV